MLDVYKDGRVFYNEEELKQQYTTKGMVVTIDAREYYVHKLVAERYLKDYKPFYKVVHINGNVTDNKVENLKIEIPLDFLEVTNPGKRPITLRHKTTGETFKFETTLIPEGTPYTPEKWAIYDNTIATISDDGLITALKPGSTEVTFCTAHNPYIYRICTIIVVEN